MASRSDRVGLKTTAAATAPATSDDEEETETEDEARRSTSSIRPAHANVEGRKAVQPLDNTGKRSKGRKGEHKGAGQQLDLATTVRLFSDAKYDVEANIASYFHERDVILNAQQLKKELEARKAVTAAAMRRCTNREYGAFIEAASLVTAMEHGMNQFSKSFLEFTSSVCSLEVRVPYNEEVAPLPDFPPLFSLSKVTDLLNDDTSSSSSMKEGRERAVLLMQTMRETLEEVNLLVHSEQCAQAVELLQSSQMHLKSLMQVREGGEAILRTAFLLSLLVIALWMCTVFTLVFFFVFCFVYPT